MMTPFLPAPASRARAGFTLPELLLASTLGAMLLTALAVTTFGFANNLHYLEVEAGVNSDADPVLRRMTREVREAWYVEQPSAQALDIHDPEGGVTKYWVDDGELWIERPSGDSGVVYDKFQDFTIQSLYTVRKREGPLVSSDGTWYSAKQPVAAPGSIVKGQGSSFALGFVAPVLPADIPGQAALEEEVVSVSISVVEVPIAWYHESEGNSLTVSLYESWAPGAAEPYGAALASVNVVGSALPLAHKTGEVWDVPTTSVPISLNAALTPGVGYAVVFTVFGNNKLVLKGLPVTPSVDYDETASKPYSSSNWTTQPYVVPFSARGPWARTSTIEQQVISMVTMTAYPFDRPLQQRSAAVLSQVFTTDPWLGVVPGETP